MGVECGWTDTYFFQCTLESGHDGIHVFPEHSEKFDTNALLSGPSADVEDDSNDQEGAQAVPEVHSDSVDEVSDQSEDGTVPKVVVKQEGR